MPMLKKEEDKEEEEKGEAALRKVVKRERKRKRSKLPLCKCKEVVKRVDKLFEEGREYILWTLTHHPEMTGKILEVTAEAVNFDIVLPLHSYKQKLTYEKHQGLCHTLLELDKDRLCRALVHHKEDSFPPLGGANGSSDEESDEESDEGGDEESDEESDEGGDEGGDEGSNEGGGK